MTGIKHVFESAVADGVDDDLVQPSDWNDYHVIDSEVNFPDLASLTDPADATPSALDGINFGALKVAGRDMPAYRPVNGLTTFLQSFIGRKSLKAWFPIGNSTSITALGAAAFTLGGTATTSNVVTTNLHTMSTRVDYLVTTPAVNAIASFREGSLIYNVGDANGGFHYTMRFGFATGVTNSTKRGFCGLVNSASNQTDVDPSTITDMVGVGFDNGDTNFQIMHNDASGTATRVDTGIAVPSADRDGVYEISIFCKPGESIVHFEFTHLDSGTTFTTTATTVLPANTVFMAHRAYHSAGGTSSVVGIAFFGGYIEKNN